MRQFDREQLQPNEFALRICTNRAVNAARFTRFIDCIGSFGGYGGIPHYDLEIVELAKGSIFGRFRPNWSEPLDDSHADQMKAALTRLRDRLEEADKRDLTLAERQTIAAERQANAAEHQARDTRIGWQVAAAIGVSALVFSIVDSIRDEEPNFCGQAAADLMESDDAYCIELWSQKNVFRIEKRHVPEMQRRAEGIRATPLAVSPVTVDNDQVTFDGDTITMDSGEPLEAEDGHPIMMERDTPAAEEDGEFIPDIVLAGPSVPARRGRGAEGARPAGGDPVPGSALWLTQAEIDNKMPGAPGSLPAKRTTPFDTNQLIQRADELLLVGIVERDWPLWRFWIDSGRHQGKYIALIVPRGADVTEGRRYQIGGKVYRGADDQPILLAEHFTPSPPERTARRSRL